MVVGLAFFLLLMRPLWSFSATATASGKPICRQEELSLLLAFKKSFFNETNCLSGGGTAMKMASWAAEDGNCCQWGGVTCNTEDGHVIGISLSSSCLSGILDSKATIFGLVNLQELNLSRNNFYQSEIPPAIGRLTGLTTLDLSSSGFSGELIPEVMSPLSNLTTIDLSGNQAMNISGLGELLRSLNKIEELHLSRVMLTDGKVPTILANMTSLRSLDLSNCRLSGEFPDSIFALPRLEFLDVSSNNQLMGRLTGFHRGSQIKSLQLSMMNLTGGLPASLGNLSHLTRLDLGSCGLWGEIPSSIGNLTNLNYLDLSSNNFQGPIPPLGDLTNLTELNLYSNRLIGEIPSSLGNLIRLKRLYLSSNQLAGGIPASLMQLSKLTVLDLSKNLLTGSIPSQISNLTLLSFLWLSSNKLSGPIPDSIYGLPNLTLIFLQSNSLTGVARLDLLLELKGISRIDFSSNAFSSVVIPKSNASIPQIGMLSLDSCNLTEVPRFLENQNSLDHLSFSNNNISGSVPQWLMQKPLQYLDLSFNNIQGTLPIPSTSINYYLMSNNQLSGEVSSSVCKLKGILVLDLADNEFTGELPPCLGNSSFFLSALSLSGNNFVGKIPDFNNVINFISVLDLGSNSFEGPLPKSLLNCSVLEYVNLGRNKIVDTFPTWLGSLPSLKVLMLHSNKFYGEMKAPSNDSWFPSLQVITLSDNNMAGMLPSDYFAHLPAMKYFSPDDDEYPNSLVGIVSMTIMNKGIEREFGKTLGSFTLLDLSSNNFNGTIPDSIGDNLLKLHTLNLSNNDLSGSIPLSLVNLKNLEVLDLSRNRLSGVIPGALAQITSLNVFNVSYNNLSGYIPGGNQFGTFENSSYIGNPELCGTPLTKKCGNVPESPPISEDEQGEDTGLPLRIVWITALVGLAGGLMVGVALEHALGANFLRWLEAKWPKYQR